MLMTDSDCGDFLIDFERPAEKGCNGWWISAHKIPGYFSGKYI